MKKLISFALAWTLCLGLAFPALAAEEGEPAAFSDVPENHTFYAAVMDCAAKGITSGYDDGTFKPANPVTKAQFCVMMARAFYPGEVQALSTEENKAVAWYYPNALALKNAGALQDMAIADALANKTVMGQAIPRYQMAQLITNVMANQGFSATAAQKAEAQKQIGDYENAYTGYQDAMANVYALGIISGYSDGNFHGHDTMNRGQGCMVIYRMAQYTPTTSKPVTPDGGTPIAPAPKPETPAAPAQPETSAGQTLSNGQPVTEANVLALIDELQTKYPQGTSFVNGYNVNGQEFASTYVNKVTSSYTRAEGGITSTTRGCGGWAAMVSDYIFGRDSAPARKVSVQNARPGDIAITLNQNGKLTHVSILTTKPVHNDELAWWEWHTTDATDEQRTKPYYIIWHREDCLCDDGWGYSTDFWTRYPD